MRRRYGRAKGARVMRIREKYNPTCISLLTLAPAALPPAPLLLEAATAAAAVTPAVGAKAP